MLKTALLWMLFLAMCFGLGYPTLNRYDPAITVIDAAGYRDMAIHLNGATLPAFNARPRILTPYLAHIVFRYANGRLGSWDPGYFALLVVNSFFVSATALLIFLLCLKEFRVAGLALVAALLYLLNFAVPNLLLAGLVDSGEAFALMAMTYMLSRSSWWCLPAIVVVGTLAKETLLPIGLAYSTGWALADRSKPARWKFGWICAAAAAGLLTAILVLTITTGHNPWSYFLRMRGSGPKLNVAFGALADRTIWYVFFYLLPLGLVRVVSFRRPWRAAVLSAVVLAFILEIYHNPTAGEAGPAFARVAFEIAGPLLSSSLALFLVNSAVDG